MMEISQTGYVVLAFAQAGLTAFAYLYGDYRGYNRGLAEAVAYEKGALNELKRQTGNE